MNKNWFDEAWEDYLYWQIQDKKTLKRINAILKDIERSPFEGIGKPEPLRGNFSGLWSRRIDEKTVSFILSAMAPYRFSPAKDIMNRKWIDVLNRINGSI